MQVLHALNDRVIVEPLNEGSEEKKGSLYVVKLEEKLPSFARIYDVGPSAGLGLSNDLRSLRTGDTVVVPKYAGQQVELDDGTKLVILGATEILARVEEK